MNQAEQQRNVDPKFVLRFDTEGQRAHLKARAALNRRTLNGEILYLIERGMVAVDEKTATA